MKERYTMRIIVYIVGDDVCCIIICPKVSAKPKLSRNEFLRASTSTSQAFHGYAGQRTESGTVCGSGFGVWDRGSVRFGVSWSCRTVCGKCCEEGSGSTVCSPRAPSPDSLSRNDIARERVRRRRRRAMT